MVELGIIWWYMEVVSNNMVVDRIGGDGGGIGNNMVVD